MKFKKSVLSTSIVMGIAAFSSQSFAAGFSITQQNTSGLGNAYAGQAALAENATAMWYNPANLTRLDRQLSLSAVYSTVNYDLSSSLVGEMDADDAIIPAFSLAYPISDSLVLGFSLNAPFGQNLDYTNNFLGLLDGAKTEITMLNYNFAAGYKLTTNTSVGAGVNYQTIEADLTNRVPGVGVQAARLEGDDTNVAWNIGINHTPGPHTSFGLAYRSSSKFTADGSVFVFNQAPFLNPATPATLDVELPDTLSLAINHNVSERTELLFSAVRFGWASLKSLDPKLKNSQLPADAVAAIEKGLSKPFGWENVYRLALGVNYTYSDTWKLRAGLAFDKSPVPNAELRSPRSPADDRTWYSAGATYSASDTLSVDMGYTYVDVAPSEIIGATYQGSYDITAHLAGVQLNWKF